MEVRARTEDDLEPTLALLGRVHTADGYPSTLYGADSFLAPPYEVAAWVAVAGGEVVGHVALHRPPGSATAAVASHATGLRPEQHLVLSRLFTSPAKRGQGIGKRLLAEAQREAARRGEQVVLDVGKAFPSAAELYESAGWSRVAEDRQKVGDEVFDVWVYVAPSAERKLRKQYHFRPSEGGLYAWDVDRLLVLAQDQPTEQVPLDAIHDVDSDYWFSHGYAPTVRAVVEHVRRINEADLSYPIVIDPRGGVMDGMHRVSKALLLGQPTISAKRLPVMPHPDYADVQPDDLPYE